jgi:hypothetical protein
VKRQGCTCSSRRSGEPLCLAHYPARAEAPAPDAVHHPGHYTAAGGVAWVSDPGLECIAVTQHMTFNLGNAVKYIWRAGSKGSRGQAEQDLRKAQQYIAFELQRLNMSDDNQAAGH